MSLPHFVAESNHRGLRMVKCEVAGSGSIEGHVVGDNDVVVLNFLTARVRRSLTKFLFINGRLCALWKFEIRGSPDGRRLAVNGFALGCASLFHNIVMIAGITSRVARVSCYKFWSLFLLPRRYHKRYAGTGG